MPRENADLGSALRRYRALMLEGAYFEAHEVLEEAWHPLRRADDPRRHLAKGLINAAIALEHLRRNRPKSRRVALKAMQAYDRRKAPLPSSTECREEFRICCDTVEELRGEWGI